MTLLDGVTNIGTVIADASGAWSITSTATLANGTHTITARATDAAGNVGAASAALAVSIDTLVAAPSRPNLAPGSDNGLLTTDNITTITTPAFTGTAETGSTVSLLDGTVVVGTGVAIAGRYTITASPLASGVHNFSATATDVAGNLSLASAALAVTIVGAPTTPSTPDMVTATDTGVSNADNITRTAAPRFTGTAAPLAVVTLYDGATAIGSAAANALGVWTITSAALADGNHSITAMSVDRVGLVSAMSAALPVTIDSAAPASPSMPVVTAASDSGVVGDNLTNVRMPTFTGTAEAGSTVALFNGTARIGTAIADAATGAWSITSTPNLAAGVRSITATATDVAGNVSVASAAQAITIDFAAPARPAAPTLLAAQDTGVSGTDRITKVNNPTFTGTAQAGTTVTLYDGTTVLGTAVATTGTYSIASPILADGVHSITVKAMDAAGNTSTASRVASVTIDTTSPAAPALTAGTATRLTGTGEAGATVSIINNAATLSTATVGAAGNWNWTFVAPSTALTVSVLQTDKAGNAGAPSGQAIIGTAGANTLTGGGGTKLLIGGAGADTFVFAPGFGKEMIADFAVAGGAHDVVFFQGNAVLNSFANVLANATQVGTATVIAGGGGDTLTLNNVTRTALVAADFRFA